MVIFSFIMTIIMSLTMIGFGFLFVKMPPSEINGAFGYRTKMSTINKSTWDFAHRYAGKAWIASGIAVFIVSILFIFTMKNFKNFEQLMPILFYIQIAALLIVVPLTEIKLRKEFDVNGIKKHSS